MRVVVRRASKALGWTLIGGVISFGVWVIKGEDKSMARAVYVPETGTLVLEGDGDRVDEMSIKPSGTDWYGRVNDITYKVPKAQVRFVMFVATQTAGDKVWIDQTFKDSKTPYEIVSPSDLVKRFAPIPTVTLPLLSGYHDKAELVLPTTAIIYVVDHVIQKTDPTTKAVTNEEYCAVSVMPQGNKFYIALKKHQVLEMLQAKGWGIDKITPYVYPYAGLPPAPPKNAPLDV